MLRDAPLLSWIIGGVLALSAGTATAQAPNAAAPSAAGQGHPPSANAAAASGDLAPVEIAPTARQQLPPGQVWECEVNGVRVFSDTQCGAHASVRQLRDLNIMAASSVPVPARPYPANYPPNAGYNPSDATADDYGSDPYVGVPYAVLRERYRRVHPRHQIMRPHPRGHN